METSFFKLLDHKKFFEKKVLYGIFSFKIFGAKIKKFLFTKSNLTISKLTRQNHTPTISNQTFLYKQNLIFQFQKKFV